MTVRLSEKESCCLLWYCTLWITYLIDCLLRGVAYDGLRNWNIISGGFGRNMHAIILQ